MPTCVGAENESVRKLILTHGIARTFKLVLVDLLVSLIASSEKQCYISYIASYFVSGPGSQIVSKTYLTRPFSVLANLAENLAGRLGSRRALRLRAPAPCRREDH